MLRLPGGFRRRLLLAVLFAAFAARYWAWRWLAESDSWPAAILVALGFGEAALLGMWAILGPGPAWVRIPRTMYLLAGPIVIVLLGYPANPFAWAVVVVLFHLGSFLGTGLLFIALRSVRGWRILPKEMEPALGNASKRQVSLRTLLADMLVFGVILALARGLDDDVIGDLQSVVTDVDFYQMLPVWALFLAGMQLPMVPIVHLILTDQRPRPLRSIPVALGLLAVSSLAEGAFFAVWDEASLFELATALGWVAMAYVGAIASLFVVRLAGYRLVRTSRRQESPGKAGG